MQFAGWHPKCLPGQLALSHLLFLAQGDLSLQLPPGCHASCQLSIPLGILLCQGSVNHAVPVSCVQLLLSQQCLQMLPVNRPDVSILCSMAEVCLICQGCSNHAVPVSSVQLLLGQRCPPGASCMNDLPTLRTMLQRGCICCSVMASQTLMSSLQLFLGQQCSAIPAIPFSRCGSQVCNTLAIKQRCGCSAGTLVFMMFQRGLHNCKRLH